MYLMHMQSSRGLFQEVFLNLLFRLDELYVYSPKFICLDGPSENSGEKYLSSRQGKTFSNLWGFFFNKVKTFSFFQVIPHWNGSQNKIGAKESIPEICLHCSLLILFFTGSFKGLVLILFWKWDKYWNLLFSPPERLFLYFSHIRDDLSGKEENK